MANNNADGEIVLGLQIAQTTQLIQSQLNQLSKNLSLLITGKLDYAKTSSQLKKDLKKIKENVNLIGSIDKSKLKKDVQAAVSQVQVAPKIDTSALQKQIGKVNINPNVEGNSELQQMGSNLDSINKKSAATVASVGLLNQAFRTLQNTAKQMIRTAAELDQQLTDLRMVTGQNYEDASRLVNSYNALAKELGATTSQVVDAADEWLRQGKSIAEVEQLIAQSMVLSKVGKMDSADATKNLTSAMKGYGLAVDEVSGIVDKLTAIDLQAAVSSADLAIAMSRTASSASMAGVSMDKLLGYLAVMKETTQSSAEEIGTAMRSIFARLQNVKVGKFVDDETGEAINDVEKALGKIGIALRDTNGDFRNMETVLDEVAAKWDSLTNLEQSAIATSIAGTRQRNQFLILMQNYGKALEYAEVATNSEGTAMKKFAAYQESVEAHFNSLIASAEALSKQTFPPELLNGFIDAGAAIGKVEGSVKEANESAKKALKEQGDYLDDLLKYVMEMIKQEVKNQIDGIEKQIDNMKEIVDLQKKSLDLEREKDKYTKNVADKTKELAKLQQQLALLELDDSRESAAKQAKLKEEIADLSNDLADDQADHAYDATSDMLDDMYDAYEKEKKKEIETLENTISSEEKVYSAAIKRISENWDTLYSDLTNWVYNYGNITQNTLDEAWNNASLAVQKYGSYLEAVLQTQQQLAALEASSSSSSTVIGGGLGTTGTPNIIGNTGNYDTSGKDTFAQANSIVEQMKQNSANWHSGDKAALHNDNRNLAKQLETLLGWPIDFDEKSGTWYMRGKKLYDQFPIYHSGGIVGDDPTLKQDEVFAKLKKGEAVFTEEQKKPIYQALDFAETMLGKYGKVLSSISGSDLMGVRMQEQIKQDTQQAQNLITQGGDSFDIDVPVQIYPLQKLDEKEIKGLTDKISKYTIAELDDVFALRGKRSLRR